MRHILNKEYRNEVYSEQTYGGEGAWSWKSVRGTAFQPAASLFESSFNNHRCDHQVFVQINLNHLRVDLSCPCCADSAPSLQLFIICLHVLLVQSSMIFIWSLPIFHGKGFLATLHHCLEIAFIRIFVMTWHDENLSGGWWPAPTSSGLCGSPTDKSTVTLRPFCNHHHYHQFCQYHQHHHHLIITIMDYHFYVGFDWPLILIIQPHWWKSY